MNVKICSYEKLAENEKIADNQLFVRLMKTVKKFLLVIIIVSSVQSFKFFPFLEAEIARGHFRNLSGSSQNSKKIKLHETHCQINL